MTLLAAGSSGAYEYGYYLGREDACRGHTSENVAEYLLPATVPSSNDGYRAGYEDAVESGAPGFETRA